MSVPKKTNKNMFLRGSKKMAFFLIERSILKTFLQLCLNQTLLFLFIKIVEGKSFRFTFRACCNMWVQLYCIYLCCICMQFQR